MSGQAPAARPLDSTHGRGYAGAARGEEWRTGGGVSGHGRVEVEGVK